jgi:hypothetical protein
MSRVNIGAKLYVMPMPVFMISSYDDKDKPCAMLAVWGGISNEKEISITVASQRYTLKGMLVWMIKSWVKMERFLLINSIHLHLIG